MSVTQEPSGAATPELPPRHLPAEYEQPAIDLAAEAAVTQRRRVLLAVVAVAVLAAVVGFAAGSRLRSSDDALTSAAPPEASLITVPVERRVISSTVVVRGDVRFEESTAVMVAGGFGADVNPVVTRVPVAVDDVVGEGDVLVEVGGRPVFLLQGELPTFRDLRPGREGDDVVQLQAALGRLGHLGDQPDGVYGLTTEEAVAAFYDTAGYGAPGPTEEEQSQLRTARDAVDAARASLRSAEQGLADAGRGVSEAMRLSLDAEVAAAEAELGRVRRDADDRLAAARGARAEAERARDGAKVVVAGAEAQLVAAQERLGQARAGTHPDTGAPPTTSELGELEAAVGDAEAALVQARDGLHERELALVDADRARTEAETEMSAQLRQAEAALAIARANRAEALAPADTALAAQAVTDARQALARSEAELASLEAGTGITMPQSELVFLPELPRRVEAVSVERGDAVEGPVIVVSGVDLVIDSGVSAADRPLLNEGMEVVLDEPGLDIEVAGEIVFLASSPGTGDVGQNRYEMRIRAIEALPREARGLNLRVVIPVTSTDGEVLAVPLAALSAGADGTARVEVADDDGATRLVPVQVGLSAGGFAEISSLGGELAEGDRVVVGTEGAGSGTGAEDPIEADLDTEDTDGDSDDTGPDTEDTDGDSDSDSDDSVRSDPAEQGESTDPGGGP